LTGSLVYLDSSAIVKLVVREPESRVLFAWLQSRSERLSSSIARVEVLRAARRADRGEAALGRARDVLDRIALVPVDRPVLAAAGLLDPPDLRSLDAIHLATALSLGGDLGGLVTSDERLGEAASAAGIEVWTPA
jgi:predicted nucleic acid-binding protein